MSDYHSDGDDWMTEIAKANLTSAGYTVDFEDVSYHDYQGTIRYTARNPDTGKWGECGYSYGSCSYCGSTEDWTEDMFREALADITERDDKPERSWY